MSLDDQDKERIARRMSFVLQELSDLAPYSSMDYKQYREDRTSRRNVERIAENVSNACIDIGKILLARSTEQLPASYREVFEQLQQLGLVPEELTGHLTDLARMRNVLAHEYLDLRWDLVKRFIRDGQEAVKTFLGVVHKTYFAPTDETQNRQ